jgi:hypothetical protein
MPEASIRGDHNTANAPEASKRPQVGLSESGSPSERGAVVRKLVKCTTVGQSHSMGTGVMVTIVYSGKSLQHFDFPVSQPYSEVAGLSSK